MLDSIRRGQRWLTAALVLTIGIVFIVFFGPWAGQQAPTSGTDAVVELDGHVIDTSDFYRRREMRTRQLREQLGDGFDEKAASAFLDQQTLRLLVEQAVLAHSARDLGIRVTRKEIQTFLRDNYRNSDGSFDQEQIVDLIEREYGTQRLFLETIERELLSTKMIRLLTSQARISDIELKEVVHFAADSVRLAYVQLDTTSLPGNEGDAEAEPPGDTEIEAFLTANEAALRERYQDEIATYTTPERVRARHLLLEVPAGADAATDTTARDEAEEARKRILEGAPFADVAREVSDDRGTRESGGDLGLVSRSEMAEAIAQAAFDLEVGSVSEVVRSLRGYHVVLIDEKITGGTRSYEEVARDLAREGIALEASKARANEMAEELAEAIREGTTLEDAARLQDLTVMRTGSLRRRADGFIPDLGAAPELLALAFALEGGESSPRIFELGNRLVLIQLISRDSLDETEVDTQIVEARESLQTQKRSQIVQAWIDAEQRRLEADQKLRVNATLVVGS